MEMVKLNNGVKIPAIGFGTYQIPPLGIAERAVSEALKIGYRHVDTAAIYYNEGDVGKAIKKSGLGRDEIFVTTKLWNSDHANVEKALNKSLKNLGLGHVDLYLMHWPTKNRNDSWRAMGKLVDDGKCKAIGVSNFTVSHLKELLSKTEVVPAVNQVEFSPFLYQKELLEFCESKGIRVEAYSPLTRGKRLKDKRLIEVAENLGKTVPQILIRWCLEKGLIVLPKSKTKARIQENFDVFRFSIDKKAMETLDSLNENAHYCWDPTEAP